MLFDESVSIPARCLKKVRSPGTSHLDVDKFAGRFYDNKADNLFNDFFQRDFRIFDNRFESFVVFLYLFECHRVIIKLLIIIINLNIMFRPEFIVINNIILLIM